MLTPQDPSDRPSPVETDEALQASSNWDQYSELAANPEAVADSYELVLDYYMATAAVEYQGQSLIVRGRGTRFGFEGDPSQESFTYRVRALQRTAGRRALEQLVAFSIDDTAVVTQRAAGESLGALAAEDADNITEAQFTELFEVIEDLDGLEIETDAASTENFIYSRDLGFTVIDFEARSSLSSHTATPEEHSMDMLYQIALDHRSNLAQPAAREAWLSVIKRGRNALVAKYSEIFDSPPKVKYHRDSWEFLKDL